jgi:hypothetical protein
MKTELTPKEYEIVDNTLESLSLHSNILPVRNGCEIFYRNREKYGRYGWVTDSICLPDTPGVLPERIPTIVHELIHRQQRKRYWLPIYLILSCRFWQSQTPLEKEAVCAYNLAESLMYEL